ncbi:molybdate ABC transporter substrate-binding protein [Gilvimarinus sp. 1_MG-2023]|uniref:molybdate ABC transporter substrate-binding protein n=1 Tax=Gilvimarinus sp. 1_MG-2023 TaxID=3062638 RepID=UPI0026E4613C|nr:molybdate ABC transporter substrate-binding protein [Gilvimarinus sp. 1_MG-2023]MDO6748202.1 molybdate ABC transporter substrate-binding protein [Gilvimarinus sp. 1_MG-2023]
MRFFLLSYLILASANTFAATSIKVAVASNFKPTLEALRSLWQSQSPYPLVISGGASGVFTQQILSGAPFDVFLSADMDYPQRIFQKLDTAEPFIYAEGQLMLACHRPFASATEALKASPRLAVANTKTAPYGRAARMWLQQFSIQAQPVQSTSVAGALHTVVTGNVTCGLVAASFAHIAPQLHWHPVEASPSLPQAGVLLSTSDRTQAFMQFLLSEPAQTIIRNNGYTSPPSKAAQP